MKIKALSIREPYVERILAGLKPEEFRSTRCVYRGPVLIHSAKALYETAPWEHWDGLGEEAAAAGRAVMARRHAAARGLWPHPLGHVRGIAYLAGCRVVEIRSGSPLYGWRLERVLRLDNPFAIRGQLGLFDVDLDRVGTFDACREIAAWLAGSPPLFGPMAAGGAA